MPDDPNQPTTDQAQPPEPKPEEEKKPEENPEPQQPDPTEEPKPTEETPPVSEIPPTPEPQPATPPQQPESPQPPESPKPEEQKPEEKPKEEPKSEPPKEEKPLEPEPKVTEPEKSEVNVGEEVKKQLDEKVKELLQKANEKRKLNRENNLNQIVDLARKRQINNQDVRDLLQVSQSTASEYLTELTKSGKLKSEGEGKARVYKA